GRRAPRRYVDGRDRGDESGGTEAGGGEIADGDRTAGIWCRPRRRHGCRVGATARGLLRAGAGGPRAMAQRIPRRTRIRDASAVAATPAGRPGDSQRDDRAPVDARRPDQRAGRGDLPEARRFGRGKPSFRYAPRPPRRREGGPATSLPGCGPRTEEGPG